VENAQVQATDYLANGLNKVTSADFKGTPQDAAKAIMADYQLMRQTMTLPEHARKGALQDVVTRLASSGQTSVLTALLDTKMDDIGTLRSFIGETKAATLTNNANNTFDGQQRQRIDEEALPWYQAADKGELNLDALRKWGTSNKKYVTSAFINSIENANQASVAKAQRELLQSQLDGAIAQSEAVAQQATLAAFREGNLWRVEGVAKPKVLGRNGEPKDFDVKEYITKAGVIMTANLPFDQQVSAFALNGLEHPDWKNQMQAGYMNLATIKVDAKGKPQGELNEAGKASIALFRHLDSTNTEYTRSLLSESVYKRFSNISFLLHFGKSEAEAASIAANADSGSVIGSDVEKLEKKIHSAATKLVQPEWYQVGWVQRLRGDNTSANTAQVTGTVRQYASLLVKSGMYGDAESALDAVARYVASPQVSAKVNGTLYMRSEMPTGPAMHTQEEWFARYIDEVVKPIAKAQGSAVVQPLWDGPVARWYAEMETKHVEGRAAADPVRLEYDPAAKLYRAFVGGGLPLIRPDSGEVLMVPKNEIERWYQSAAQGDIARAVVKGQKNAADKTYEAYRKRVWGEVGQVQKEQGRFAMERYDGTVNKSGLENRILGPEAHKRIVADGNAGKSLAELMKLYPAPSLSPSDY
jgi:hypothetical protein